MTSTKGCGTHLGDKIRLLLQVVDGGKRCLERQRVGWSSIERRVMGALMNYLDNCASTQKMNIEALERLMEPEKRSGLSKVHPEVLDERSQ